MTDFVDRLLGRSPCAPIRPLLPTLYEPVAFGAADEPLPMGSFTDSAGSEHATGTAAAEELSVPEPPRALLTAAGPPSAVHPATISPAARGAANEPPHAAPRGPAPALSPPATPPHQMAAGPLVRRPSREHPRPPGPSSAATSPAEEPAVRRSVGDVPSRIPTTAHERVLARPNALQQDFVRERDRAREPDVHISIGRVEIKAAVTAASPARRADSSRRPQLTLDDYLKSRGG